VRLDVNEENAKFRPSFRAERLVARIGAKTRFGQ